MVECQICHRKFKSLKSLSVHLMHNKNVDNHPKDSKGYYDIFMKKEGEGICSSCGGETVFNTIVTGYNKYCSRECSGKDITRIRRTKSTLIRKYGVKNASQLNWVKEKKKETCRKNFGVDHPMQSREIMNKSLSTMKAKYGKHAAATNFVKEKMRQTNLERWGYEFATQSPIVQQKFKKTYSKIIYRRLINSDRLKGMCIPLFEEDEYGGYLQKHPWKCTKCNNIFEDNLDDGHIPRCPLCYPPRENKLQNEVSEFCKQFFPNLIENDRKILDGKEIDIFIPEKNIGIEFDGLYYHSEISKGFGPKYHIAKTELAKSKGIRLIHIFEDEWLDKNDIVKSIILSKFGIFDFKIFARNCITKEAEKKESSKFLFENHLQGERPGFNFGLYHENELISLMVLGPPRYNKNYEWEILRFCTRKNIQALGGLSKLLTHFIKLYDPSSIITYVDLRYGTGESYKKIGFNLVGKSKSNYYYMDFRYQNRESRLKYQKHNLSKKLKLFDPNLTEWENMQLNGFDRIWDCGNNIYEWRKKS